MPQAPDEPPSDVPEEEDELDRGLRELIADAAGPARFREPSAAERARTAARQAKQRDPRKARRPREPSGMGSPVPPREPRNPGGLRTTVITLVVLACIGGLVAAFSVLGHHSKAGSTSQAGSHASSHPAASSSPVPSATPTATLADPFAGTPASAFADGSAGIIRPAAHAVGTYSASQVRAAYATTAAMLIAAALNQRTLRGGTPSAFADLLIPQERKYFLARLDHKGLDKKGFARSTRGWVASFAPGSAALDGTVIKVHGSMRARRAVVNHRRELQVHADYLFVYPVANPNQATSFTRIVFRLVVNVDFAPFTDPGGALEAWWGYVGGGPAGVVCGINDGFIHPAFPGAGPGKVAATGAPVNPYDQSIPPDAKPGCQATTGT